MNGTRFDVDIRNERDERSAKLTMDTLVLSAKLAALTLLKAILMPYYLKDEIYKRDIRNS
nr:hypothetical protein [Campylobacter jejuni]